MVRSPLMLVTNTVFLVTQPLSLVRLLWKLLVRIVCIITLAWFGFFKFFFSLHLDVCWRLTGRGIAVITVPIRLFTALQREKQLKEHLHELQSQLDDLICINKDLEQRLDVAIKEQKRTENILVELEEEQCRATEKLHLLEIKVREGEDEILRLRKMTKRRLLKADAVEHIENGGKEEDTEHVNREHMGFWEKENGNESGAEDEAWNSKFERRGKILDSYPPCREFNFYGSEKEFQQVDSLLEKPKESSGHLSFSKKLEANDEIIYQRRGIALAQSAFSACLSVLVGMIAWEAQDPCLPLVIALFIVAGMSLKSVVQLFARIENRPGSDAVALLCFNWFILGTLASPALPNVAQILVPLASDFGCQIANWFGFSMK